MPLKSWFGYPNRVYSVLHPICIAQ